MYVVRGAPLSILSAPNRNRRNYAIQRTLEQQPEQKEQQLKQYLLRSQHIGSYSMQTYRPLLLYACVLSHGFPFLPRFLTGFSFGWFFSYFLCVWTLKRFYRVSRVCVILQRLVRRCVLRCGNLFIYFVCAAAAAAHVVCVHSITTDIGSSLFPFGCIVPLR